MATAAFLSTTSFLSASTINQSSFTTSTSRPKRPRSTTKRVHYRPLSPPVIHASNNDEEPEQNGTASPKSDHKDEKSMIAKSPVVQFLSSKIEEAFDKPSPELFAITSAYFVQGALGISRLATSFFLKDDLHLSPATSSALTGIIMIPWLIKPLYGAISDTIPIYRLRRKPYLLLASLVGSLSWLSLSTVVHDVPMCIFTTTLASLTVAFSDVVVDSLVVERSRNVSTSKAGGLQSLCWGTSAVGGLLTAYFSGSLIEALGTRGIFKLTSVLPLLTGIAALYINEKPIKPSENVINLKLFQTKVSNLWKALSYPTVYLPTLFIFLWQSTPNADSALFYFQTNVLNFGPEFLGSVRLICSISSLLGIVVFNSFLKQKPIKSIMKWSSIICVPLTLAQVLLVTRWNLQLGIPDKTFALFDSAMLTVLGQIAFMPTLVLAARLCPPGVEGTLFAALMSVFNASGATSNELGALSMYLLHVNENDYSNLPLLIVLCSFGNLLPLPLLSLMDRAPPPPPGSLDNEGENSSAQKSIEGSVNVVGVGMNDVQSSSTAIGNPTTSKQD